MTPVEAVLALSDEQLHKLQSLIIEAGLRKEMGRNDFRRFFKELRRRSKGKLRVLYAALCKADDDTFDRVCDAIIGN